MIRVLFLDIDGVILSGEELWASGNRRHLPPAKVELLRGTLMRAGAVVVVSSTWRYSDDTRHLLISLGVPLHRDWRTDNARRGEVRGVQIKRWLEAHPEVEAYAIVDDDDDMLPDQKARFIQAPFLTGLAQEHCDAIVASLNRPRNAPDHITPMKARGL